jgi:hypothetical protein
VHVSAVSEAHAYLPVGIIHRQPTTTSVTPVGARPRTSGQGAAAEADGPKLLVDLSLIAPRPSESSRAAASAPAAGPGGTERCETCARRKYRDRSDDPSVSFQTPTHLSPSEAEVMVRRHEQEHVQHETAKAEREGKEVETRVSIHYAVCPECGRVYVSGGTTQVTTRGSAAPAAAQPSAAALGEASSASPGLDLVA